MSSKSPSSEQLNAEVKAMRTRYNKLERIAKSGILLTTTAAECVEAARRAAELALDWLQKAADAERSEEIQIQQAEAQRAAERATAPLLYMDRERMA